MRIVKNGTTVAMIDFDSIARIRNRSFVLSVIFRRSCDAWKPNRGSWNAIHKPILFSTF